jgi:hypothetical protein
MNEEGATSEEAKVILKNPRNQLDPSSLRAEQAVAKFGKAARHPLCLAGLDLWALEAKRSKLMKDAQPMKEFLDRADQNKKRARELYEHFYKEGKEKDVIAARALMLRFKELLPKVKKVYDAQANLLATYDQWIIDCREKFERELDTAEQEKNTTALRALPRVQKKWKALSNGARLKCGEQRQLGILQLVRDKKIRAEWAKGDAPAGYWEAASGSDRPLSDDEWQGRATAREIHSYLTATDGAKIAGDKDAKVIRRAAKALGIRLEEDQVGRKWKGPRPKKQKPKRPVGRPREKVEAQGVDDLEATEAADLKKRVNRVVTTDSFKVSGTGYNKKELKGIAQIDSADVASAQKAIRGIEREIEKLKMQRGGNLGRYSYE